MRLVSRYLALQYLRGLAVCLFVGTGLFLVLDFFQRVNHLARYDPTPATLVMYFASRLPMMITEIYPAAALLAVLLAVGLLNRHREILALRACGFSNWQLASPVIAASMLVSFALLAWTEVVVPPSAVRYREINDIVIKKKVARGLYNSSSLWFQSVGGFVHVDYFDAHAEILHGLTVYDADPEFQLTRILEVPEARWANGRWEMPTGTVKLVGADGGVTIRDLLPGELALTETPRDFARKRHSAREMSFFGLRRKLDMLRAKGLDATDLRVDLQIKLALPFSGVISALMGFPLAVRTGRRAGMGYTLAFGLILGLAYWVTMGVALSAGRAGVLPPVFAAWAANALFAALAVAFYIDAR